MKLGADGGFSLIELMVVMVIIGLMTSAVVVLTPPQAPSLIDDARKTASLFTAIRRQSVMAGQVYGVTIEEGALDVRTRSVQGWSPVTIAGHSSNDFLLQASLLISGTMANAVKPGGDYAPQLWFLPTGEFQSFHLTATEGTTRVVLSGAVGGAIEVMVDET